jgi:hypothetical protein
MIAENLSDWFDEKRIVYSWEDLRFPFTQTKQGATAKPDFDFTNLGLLFPQDDATEIISIIAQMPHDYVIGTNIKPHIHYQQSAAEQPVFKIDYKWFNNGDAVPATFTTVAGTGNAYTYSSGDLHQIQTWEEIDGSGITGVSSILLIKLYRDDDVLTGDSLAFEFDIHYKKYLPGSRYEYEV